MADIFEVAHYLGREYRSTLNADGSVNLLSADPEDKNRGFVARRPGLYIKTVSRDEVDSAYRLFRYGVLLGHRFPIIQVKDGRLLLSDGGKGLVAAELGFDMVGRLEYEKWVSPEELDDIEEVKRPLW